jgi:oligosaccharide translocation protein RFT1
VNKTHRLRQDPRSEVDSKSSATNNLSLLPILIGAPFSFIATIAYFTSSTPSTRSQPHFTLSVTLYGLAAFLELLCEPFYIAVTNGLRIDVRVRAEGAGIVAKNVTTFVILMGMGKDWGLVAFAAGQIMFALTMFCVYLFDAGLGAARERLTLNMYPRHGKRPRSRS